MTSKALDALVDSGLLKEEAGDQAEFDGLLRSAEQRLMDAKTKDLSPDSQFDLAYGAAHALSLAAMRWHGYRPAKRYIVFQALVHTLGIQSETWRVLDKCHGLRNSVEYEGEFNVDRQLLADLLKATECVRQEVIALGPIDTGDA